VALLLLQGRTARILLVLLLLLLLVLLLFLKSRCFQPQEMRFDRIHLRQTHLHSTHRRGRRGRQRRWLLLL
jgi:hypothetical protein